MSNRISVLAALIKHGKSTLDELNEFTGIEKNVLRYTVNDAKKAGHIDQGKDAVTQLPAYFITPEGQAWYKTKTGEMSAAPATKPSQAAMPEKTKGKPDPIINAMVSNFLGWMLPKDFSPDAGISFKPTKPDGHGTHWWPTGTNLFNAEQAYDMFAHCHVVTVASESENRLLSEISKLKQQLDEQHELLANQVVTITAWKKAASSVGIETPEMLVKVFNEQDIRLTDQIRKTNEALEQVATLETDAVFGERVNTTPAFYTVAIPKKPLRRFSKLETAQALALGAVRAGSQGEVFALHLVGKAVRGAEWKPA